MECAIKDIFFARFFNPYTAEGVQVTGFFENLDFSDYSEELTILTDVVAKNINLYLYNEYSQRYVVSTWARYMTWDKVNKRYTIDPAFYDDFTAALCSNILNAENYYLLSQLNISQIADSIVKVTEYGEKVETHERDNDTITAGAREDSETTDIGAQNIRATENVGTHTDTNTTEYGITHNESETENTRSAFNSSSYEADNKSHTENDGDAHTDETTIIAGAQENSTQTSTGARHDATTTNIGSQETTKVYGDETHTREEYTDTVTTTTTRGVDPVKLIELKKELAKLNIYQLIGDAVAATMLRKDFGYIRG